MMIAFVTVLLFFLCLEGNSQIEFEEIYMNAYVVIADTSHSYYTLRTKMFSLSERLSMEIDTMDRGYNEEKNLICLPLNHEDDLYAGGYCPRRYPSELLSLEYLVLLRKHPEL